MSIKDTWLKDIPAQFQGSPNIEALITAFSTQLDELQVVFEDLMNKTDIDTAEGENLDMLASVVNISRHDAAKLINIYNAQVLNDSVYRNVLKFQALKNNSDGTYADIMKGLYLLWGDVGANISYVENNVEPAQIAIDIADIPSDAMDPTMIRPMVIKPGGVKILFTSSFRDYIELEDWERFTNLVITTEQNHFYNGDYIYNGTIQYHPDNEKYFLYNGWYRYDGEIWYGPYEIEEVDEVDAILLNQAKTKMLQMRAQGSDGWKITHFAFGTGLVNGVPYVPTGDQTELVHEVCRTEVVMRNIISDSCIEFVGAIGTNQCNGEYITEVALVDSDGDLVCVKTFERKLKQSDVEMVFKIDDIVNLT